MKWCAVIESRHGIHSGCFILEQSSQRSNRSNDLAGCLRMDRHVYAPLHNGNASKPAITTSNLKAVRLFAILLTLTGISLGSCPLSDASDAKKPNIIFILTDDHRWDFMSCAGHPFVKTPSLDRLASAGSAFFKCIRLRLPCVAQVEQVFSRVCTPTRTACKTI